MMKTPKAFLTLALLALGLVSCTTTPSSPVNSSETSTSTSSSEESTQSSTISVTNVTLTIGRTELEVGEQTTISVAVLPTDASDKTFRYEIEDNDIVSIAGTTLSALKEGQTVVKAISTDGGKEASATITVTSNLVKYGETQMLNTLKGSIYRNDFRPDSQDVTSKTEQMGIDKDSFDNESLYPVPTENVTVYKASENDISGDNIYNGNNLNALISSLRDVEGTKIIEFEDETYSFGSTITGTGIKDLYLVGKANTKFVYNGWLTYVRFSNSSNIHINSITFDMNPSPTIVGTIKAVENETSSTATVVLDIPTIFNMDSSLYTNWNTLLQGSYAEHVYDSTYGTYIPDLSGNLFYSNGVASSAKGITSMNYNNSTRELRVTLSKTFAACSYKAPKIGNKAAIGFTVYDNHGFYFQNCEDTYIEDLTCYVVSGMGVRFDGGKNAFLNRVRFMRDENRLLTCTADILHSAHLDGEFVITNSILEGSHDDAINVKSFYTRISSIQANVVNVVQTQSEVVIDYEVGDSVEIYNPDDGFTYCGSYVVTALTRNGNNFTLTLDRNVLRSYNGLLMGNASKATHMKLENSLIANKRNRGILLQGKESVIRNCTFQNVLMGGIQVLSVPDVFAEAIVPTDVVIENNKFLQCVDTLRVFAYDTSGNSSKGVIRNLSINNNFFSRNVGQEIYVRASSDVKIKDNIILSAGKSRNVYVMSSDLVSVENNNAYFTSMNSTYGFVVTNDVTNITTTNNKNKEVTL